MGRIICRIVWISGTVLLIVSWLDLIPKEIGLAAFLAAAVAVFVSYLPSREARTQEADRRRREEPANQPPLSP